MGDTDPPSTVQRRPSGRGVASPEAGPGRKGEGRSNGDVRRGFARSTERAPAGAHTASGSDRGADPGVKAQRPRKTPALVHPPAHTKRPAGALAALDNKRAIRQLHPGPARSQHHATPTAKFRLAPRVL